MLDLRTGDMLIRAASRVGVDTGPMTTESMPIPVCSGADPLYVKTFGQDGKTASSLGTAALWYASHGIPVIPLKSGRKEPLTAHGFKDATTDVAAVEAWWEEFPSANIGIRTGAASGLFVLDVDPRNGGPAERADIVQQFGPIPETAEVITGGGGRHLYFRHSGEDLPKTIAAGVDLKGDGGYVVAPPSLHPSGQLYQWDGVSGPLALLSPAAMPEWLCRVSLSRPECVSNGEGSSGKWGTGYRNNKLTSLAGSMRRRDMSESSILGALLKENELKCHPPLSSSEVEQIVKSVIRYEPAAEIRRTENLVRISSVTWPDAIGREAYIGVAGDLVRAIEPHSEADPAALLLQFLACFGNVIGRTAHFTVEADNHFGNLFVVLVGKSGKGRKGTSLGQIRRIFSQIDSHWAKNREVSSDFTHCRELEVTINGQAFPHLIYHFVLSYSNWETGCVC